MEPASPRSDHIGGVGEMSTPELLAKREQRREMEAQAAALSRPSLSRRLLQPVQNPSTGQQQPQRQQNSVAGLAPQQTGRSVFSRAGLKRPAPAAKAAAPAPTADAGISAEDLAKLMEDEPAATPADQLEGNCAKRPKLSDLLQQHKLQPSGDDPAPTIRPGLLTVQQNKQASVSAAFGRVAAQRQQQQQDEADQQRQVLLQQEQQQVGQQQQQVLPNMYDDSMIVADQTTQQVVNVPPQQGIEQQQKDTRVQDAVPASQQPQHDTVAAAAAAGGAGPSAAQPADIGVPRWMYVKPGTAAPAAQQEAQQAAGAAGSKRQAGKVSGGRGAKDGSASGSARRSKPPVNKKFNRLLAADAKGKQQAADQAALAAELAAAGPRKKPRRASGDAGQAAAAAAGAQAAAENVTQPAAAPVARPRRQAAAAANRALTRAGAADPADDSGSDSGSDSGNSSSEDSGSDGGVYSSDAETTAKQPQCKARPTRATAAGAAKHQPAPKTAGAGGGGTAQAAKTGRGRRRSSTAPNAPAVQPTGATAGKQGAAQQQDTAAARSTKLNKHMQKLQDAVSNSRRAQQLAAAVEQEQCPTEQQHKAQPAAPTSTRRVVLATTLPNSGQQQRPAQQAQGKVSVEGPQPAAAAAHLHLPPDLAAKVQAAVAAKGDPGADAAAGSGGGTSATVAAVAAEGPAAAEADGLDGDMMLLDESDDLEIVGLPLADTKQQQEQQQQEKPPGHDQQRTSAAEAAAGHGDIAMTEGFWGTFEDGEQQSAELVSDGGDGSSSGWEESDGSGLDEDGWEGEEDAEGYESSRGGEEEGDSGDDEDVPLARRAGARRAAAVAAGAGAGAGAADADSSEQEEEEEALDSEDSEPRRRAGAASRAARSKRSSAAAASAAAEGGDAEGAPKGRRKRAGATAEAAGGDGDGGAVTKRTARKAAAGSKPRTRKTAQRNNFRRHKTSANGYGSKFLSKAGCKSHRNKKYSYKGITKSGKLIRVRRKAPHMAGQGAEFMEGFGGAGGGGGKGRCYLCGQPGHWEDDCPIKAARIAEQEAELAAWMRDNPDAEEAQRVAGGNGSAYHTTAEAGAEGAQGAQAAAAAGAAHKPGQQQQQGKTARQPPLTQVQLCEMAGLASDAPWDPVKLTDEQLASVMKAVWGHNGFRGQQLPLIRAALQGRSMLGVLPTGLGKSMTYQLPALVMQGVVVVVEPLLSLMHDQVSRLPAALPGAMLQGSMGRDEVIQILQDAEDGLLRVLYLAPEKLSSTPVMACLRHLKQTGQLQLVVVDEAHCMAEWGEGFRPAYFRLGHLLSNVLQPHAVLALSATAAPRTRASILQLLNIPQEQQVVESPLRDNLRLRVVHVAAGAGKTGVPAHVVQLLKTGELSGVSSAVVYVNSRVGADQLAAQLKRAGLQAAAYHAGLNYDQRETVQDAFLRGYLRVMVATVAFGMGLDKPDLGAVIHADMPHSLEQYVQQVGRGGRDGRVATCISFLDDSAYTRIRTLCHQKIAKRSSVERFLRCVFGRPEEDEDGPEAEAAAPGKRRKAKPKVVMSQHKVLPFMEFCTQHDIDKEQLDSCLSFLQADPLEPYVAVLPDVAATLDVRFHSTPPDVLAKTHPVIASILQSKTRVYSGTYKVHMNVLVPFTDRPPGELISELSALSAARVIGYDQSTQVQALAWRIIRQPEDWEGLVEDVYARVNKVINAAVSRLDLCYEALAGASIYSSAAAQEKHMRCMIEQYFLQEPPAQQEESGAAGAAAAAAEDSMLPWGVPHPVLRVSKDSLLRQLRAVLHNVAPRVRDLGPSKFDGLVLTRLVTGLSSPAVPQSFWKGCHEWGRMQAHDFRRVAEAAEQVVKEFWQAEGTSRLRTTH